MKIIELYHDYLMSYCDTCSLIENDVRRRGP